MQVILASASPRRVDLLPALVPDFAVCPSDIPEDLEGVPEEVAVALALAKARAVAAVHPGAVVVGADTLVFDDQRTYGKPASPDDAVAMLLALNGRWHRVVTGVAVVAPAGERTAANVSRVRLAPLTGARIVAYVASGRPLDKAGAYAIQDEDVPTVAEIDGCYCGVMGLPLWTLRSLLTAAKVSCTSPDATLPRCASCPEARP